MAIVYEPRYILRLDELPKVVEADGAVYPVLLPIKDAARLFGVTMPTILRWNETYGLPLVNFTLEESNRSRNVGRYYVEVAVLNDFIRKHSVPRQTAEEVTNP